ncbi:MAG: hypothetical protein CVU13_12370 [Bacteroidetes bacterium HGW-Bacteroidetes-8]|jgi:hypothetical protein|nr:MAG: hypothetical protein CVU13_12370 [Bacteroidetes bacterium HGW-Bacteroidetes-8]
MRKRALLIPLFVLFALAASAQKSIEYKAFADSADGFSNLYRGSAPLAYRFLHTGTFFAYGVEFLPGEVLFNDKLYTDVMLNLNSHLDELYLFIKETGRYVVLNKNFVDYFSIAHRKFYHFRESKKSEADTLSPGFYELLYGNESARLFKKTKKVYAERINHFASAATNSKLERMFMPLYSYYLIKDKETYNIKRFRDILSIYDIRRRDLRPLIREKSLDVTKDKENSFTEIISFIETSGISRK